MIRVTENLRKIRDLLANSAIQAERDPASVKLLAVSKKQPLEKVLAAASCGQRDFGENQVQEGLTKINKTLTEDLTWHFIGHLQTNKTRAVAEHFDWVHSIDRLKIAERLSRQRPAEHSPLNVCLEVNIDAEEAKSGVSPNALPELAAAVSELPNLSLRGLMCLPAIRSSFEEQRKPFAKLYKLAESLSSSGIELDTLSMGMSADFRAAIFEGATIVRIGTAVFGARI
ncbi:MAG: YggS family pyridoxal phosphate-dependent enzyme [Gammaproteobacteria bacterium]|nr:YggS family pyridoxal phosphate-dependent enzyme [Gammaproteobacteria bacterium]